MTPKRLLREIRAAGETGLRVKAILDGEDWEDRAMALTQLMDSGAITGKPGTAGVVICAGGGDER